MVAGGDDVHAAGEELLRDVRRDRLAPGGILAVDDHQADPVRVDDALELVLQHLATGPSDDVADGEYFYCLSHVTQNAGFIRSQYSAR